MTKRRAMARPMPFAAPVTITDFPLTPLAIEFPPVPNPVAATLDRSGGSGHGKRPRGAGPVAGERRRG